MLGHSDRTGSSVSWNSAHLSRNCAKAGLIATGGAGNLGDHGPRWDLPRASTCWRGDLLGSIHPIGKARRIKTSFRGCEDDAM
jgi:hypothetical protein